VAFGFELHLSGLAVDDWQDWIRHGAASLWRALARATVDARTASSSEPPMNLGLVCGQSELGAASREATILMLLPGWGLEEVMGQNMTAASLLEPDAVGTPGHRAVHDS
jgi:hypothetical protein